LKGYPKRKFSH